MTSKLSLTTLEICRRQLEAAISLYVDEGDPVAVQALAANAHEIADKMARAEGVERNFDLHRFVSEAFEIPPGTPKKVIERWEKSVNDVLFRTRNFFKHGRKGKPDEIFDFDPSETELWLLDACSAFEVVGDRRPLIGVFRMWARVTFGSRYLLTDPEHLTAMRPTGTKREFFDRWLPIAKEADHGPASGTSQDASRQS